jgi:hypothetical protein
MLYICMFFKFYYFFLLVAIYIMFIEKENNGFK